MANNLISPSVSVTVVNSSSYTIQLSSSTPLIYICTAANKTYNGQVCPGTLESGIPRAITSLNQLFQMYGTPNFYTDAYNNPLHGAAQNEYGLWAAYNLLITQNLVYIVRADIDSSFPNTTSFDTGNQFQPVFGHVVDYNFTYAGGVSNPNLAGLDQGSSLPETWTLQYNGSSFNVTGSVSGIKPNAYVGQPYNTGASTVAGDTVQGSLEFLLTAGGSNFQTGDNFSIVLAYNVNNIYVPTNSAGTPLGSIGNIGVSNSSVAENIIITITQATSNTPGKFIVTYQYSNKVDNGVIGAAFNNGVTAFTINEVSSGALSVGSTFGFTVYMASTVTYTGIGTGQLTNIVVNPYSPQTENWTLTAQAGLTGQPIIKPTAGTRDGAINNFVFFSNSNSGGSLTQAGTINLVCTGAISNMSFNNMQDPGYNNLVITANSKASLSNYEADGRTELFTTNLGTLASRLTYTPTSDAYGNLGTGAVPLIGNVLMTVANATIVAPATSDAAKPAVLSAASVFNIATNTAVNNYNDFNTFEFIQGNGLNLDQIFNDSFGYKAVTVTNVNTTNIFASLTFSTALCIDYTASTATPGGGSIAAADFSYTNTAVYQTLVNGQSGWQALSLASNNSGLITLVYNANAWSISTAGFASAQIFSTTYVGGLLSIIVTIAGQAYTLISFSPTTPGAGSAYSLTVNAQGWINNGTSSDTTVKSSKKLKLGIINNIFFLPIDNFGSSAPLTPITLTDATGSTTLCNVYMALVVGNKSSLSSQNIIFGPCNFIVSNNRNSNTSTFNIYNGFTTSLSNNTTISYNSAVVNNPILQIISPDNSINVNPNTLQVVPFTEVTSNDNSFEIQQQLVSTPITRIISTDNSVNVQGTALPGGVGSLYSFEIQPVFVTTNGISNTVLQQVAYPYNATAKAWQFTYVGQGVPSSINSLYLNALISIAAGSLVTLTIGDSFTLSSQISTFLLYNNINNVETYLGYTNVSSSYSDANITVSWIDNAIPYTTINPMPTYLWSIAASNFTVSYSAMPTTNYPNVVIDQQYNYNVVTQQYGNAPFSFLILQGSNNPWQLGDSIVFSVNVNTFSVVGSVSGTRAIATATTAAPNVWNYDNGIINFVLTLVSGQGWNAGDQYIMNVVSQISPLYPNTNTDAQKRALIVQQLAGIINSTTVVQSDAYLFSMTATPGYQEAQCIQALRNLAIAKFYEISITSHTPYWMSPENAAQWAVTNNCLSDWNLWYDYASGLSTNVDGSTIFVDGTSVGLRVIADSDANYPVWFAPAGVKRGIISSLTAIGYVSGTLGTATTFIQTPVTQGERDLLYGAPTNINPASDLSAGGKGLLMMGQKTRDPSSPSSLDRINASRLVSLMKRDIRFSLFDFIFEPDDSITWNTVTQQMTSYLSNLQAQRALYDFLVVCGSVNNTAQNIENHIMNVFIAIKIVSSAEFILAQIGVLQTDATM